MVDVFDPELRHKVMSSIRSKNSKAELIVFAYLRKEGIYFQKHYSRAPGKPDIALPRKKRAVFIDGDFWHGRNYKIRLRGRVETDPWVQKIKRNISRDKEQTRLLRESGWQVLRIWESDILRKRTSESILYNIRAFLNGN
jgi:DNA mismatch endonuclease (patch repair protein)